MFMVGMELKDAAAGDADAGDADADVVGGESILLRGRGWVMTEEEEEEGLLWRRRREERRLEGCIFLWWS